MALNTTEELVEDIRAGRMVVLMDDEDRENEGDLVLAADCVRPEDINFMARFGRGLICLTLTREHCERLNLPLMASNTYSSNSTNFTDNGTGAANYQFKITIGPRDNITGDLIITTANF